MTSQKKYRPKFGWLIHVVCEVFSKTFVENENEMKFPRFYAQEKIVIYLYLGVIDHFAAGFCSDQV